MNPEELLSEIKCLIKHTKIPYKIMDLDTTRVSQKFCKILVVHATLWHVYDLTKIVQTVVITCNGCWYYSSWCTEMYLTSWFENLTDEYTTVSNLELMFYEF